MRQGDRIEAIQMKKNSSFPVLVFIIVVAIGAASAYAMYRVSPDFRDLWILGVSVVLASVISSAIQVADQWSKAVVGQGKTTDSPVRGIVSALLERRNQAFG